MAASVTDSQAMESGGFRSTGRKGTFKKRGTGQEFGPGPGIVMGAQAIEVPAPNNATPNEIITTPDGVQYKVSPDGKVMTPINATPQGATTPINMAAAPAGQQIVMMPAQNATLDSTERRKLIKEIREEIKPLIAQIADFQIEKAN